MVNQSADKTQVINDIMDIISRKKQERRIFEYLHNHTPASDIDARVYYKREADKVNSEINKWKLHLEATRNIGNTLNINI